MIIRELEGDFVFIYPDWEAACANKNVFEAANYAGVIVCTDYEKPKEDTSVERGKLAETITTIELGNIPILLPLGGYGKIQ